MQIYPHSCPVVFILFKLDSSPNLKIQNEIIFKKKTPAFSLGCIFQTNLMLCPSLCDNFPQRYI